MKNPRRNFLLRFTLLAMFMLMFSRRGQSNDQPGIPDASILCISDCVTCPVICSSPPSQPVAKSPPLLLLPPPPVAKSPPLLLLPPPPVAKSPPLFLFPPPPPPPPTTVEESPIIYPTPSSPLVPPPPAQTQPRKKPPSFAPPPWLWVFPTPPPQTTSNSFPTIQVPNTGQGNNPSYPYHDFNGSNAASSLHSIFLTNLLLVVALLAASSWWQNV